jgi:hypothetical protein
MANELSMTVGQAHEVEMSFGRNGWSAKEVKDACAGDFLGKVRDVLLGFAEIRPLEHIINCDADPYVPEDWAVEEHQKGGTWKWNPAELKLYLSPKQQCDKWIKGEELRQELEGQRVSNANILDYLLKYPHLIPEEWKNKYIYFWGTIYRGPRGGLCVRCLYWGGGAGCERLERWPPGSCPCELILILGILGSAWILGPCPRFVIDEAGAFCKHC